MNETDMNKNTPHPMRYTGQRLRDQIDPWREMLFHCAKCGMETTGDQLVLGEYYGEGFNLQCTGCHHLVACVTHPLVSEVLKHKGELPPEVLSDAREFAKGYAHYQKAKLTRPKQLPEIELDHIVLIWDARYLPEDHNEIEFIIRCGEREIFRGPGCWECYDYFISACKVLRNKYGNRLYDVIPTERTYFYMWGDRLSAPCYMEEMRKRIRAASRIKNYSNVEIPPNESWETYRS
jgi:hypothetical protein